MNHAPLLAATLAALLAACGSCSHTTHQSFHHVESDSGGTTVLKGDITLEVVDVAFTSTSTWIDGKSTSSSTVLGHALAVHDGVLTIGPNGYGRVPPGACIRIARDGVTVDGEPRGELPPAAPEREIVVGGEQ